VALQTGILTYARLGIQAPIGKPSLTQWRAKNWRALEEQLQFGLLYGVVAYPHSPPFGGQGNVVIAGHSSAPTPEARGSAYEDVFASLPDAKRGDRIELRDANGASYVYEVTETAIIPATEVSILLQDPRVRELTLFTCYPVGTTRDRFMVRARLKESRGGVAAGKSQAHE
jgi:sortase A